MGTTYDSMAAGLLYMTSAKSLTISSSAFSAFSTTYTALVTNSDYFMLIYNTASSATSITTSNFKTYSSYDKTFVLTYI